MESLSINYQVSSVLLNQTNPIHEYTIESCRAYVKCNIKESIQLGLFIVFATNTLKVSEAKV